MNSYELKFQGSVRFFNQYSSSIRVKGRSALALRPIFAALKASIGVFSSRLSYTLVEFVCASLLIPALRGLRQKFVIF